ncbi:hypothetical protein NDU88_002853 [Pleurodeles waltl]|uniref:Uncharacterized protein n=1 Tax=Pleurodeles waltl TaxID=8319 RepID=A0AAV7KUW7_PLEWA|nr:hypothetical protein NDU88_002853 [Pleurodeles waltl]
MPRVSDAGRDPRGTEAALITVLVVQGPPVFPTRQPYRPKGNEEEVCKAEKTRTSATTVRCDDTQEEAQGRKQEETERPRRFQGKSVTTIEGSTRAPAGPGGRVYTPQGCSLTPGKRWMRQQ